METNGGRKMRELRKNESGSGLSPLQQIESRLYLHMQRIQDDFLFIGQCLIEAKEQKLVPHGQWGAWIQEHTGLTERKAQFLMKQAREIAPGSALVQLPPSHRDIILTLAPEEREEVAQRAAENDTSAEDLREEVRKRKEVERALQEARRAVAAAAEQRRLDQQAAELRIEQLKLEAQGTGGISPEAQAEIDRLTTEKADMERYAEKQAAARQEAQRKQLALQQQIARGGVAHGGEGELLTTASFAEAVRVFIGAVGTLPHMGPTLAQADTKEREAWQTYLRMVKTWMEGAEKAMNTVEGVFSCE